VCGGNIGRLRDGDRVTIDAHSRNLEVEVPVADLMQRDIPQAPEVTQTLGRNLFVNARNQVGTADQGGSFLFQGTKP
jgi:phosphogluconate dehydratase